MAKSRIPTTINVALALGASVLAATAALALPRFGDWAAPISVEGLPGSSGTINSAAVDGCVALSRDGLTLFFNSSRTGNQDIYMAKRPSRSEGFGEPQRLPEPINSSANEACPTYTQDHRLFFSSDRDDAAYDIYVARYQAGEWTAPESLGPAINRPGWLDEAATFFEDDLGRSVMVFSSRLPNGTQGKIYQSVDGGPVTLVEGGVNSAASDNRPSVTHDGLTMFFDSTRPGGLGGQDLYVATRGSTSEPFGSAVNLRALNSPGFDARPSISWDASELLFSSIRSGGEGGPDIWWTNREKASSGPKVIEF